MKVKVETYKIVCDCCGETFTDGNGFTCYSDDPDGGIIRGEALDNGWIELDAKHYCPKCYEVDDDGNYYIHDNNTMR